MGQLLEPVIRQEYANQTGRVVRVPPGTIRHAVHPFMLAHFDGVTDDGRIFEAKTSRTGEHWGPGLDEVPHDYLIQVQHYMAVSGMKLADIAVLIGGSDFRIYEIEADPRMQDLIIEGEQDFWKLVQRGVPPTPDFDTGNVNDLLKRLYPGTNGKTIPAPPLANEFRRVFEFAKNAEQNYAKVAEGAKAHLLYEMGEAARMVWPDDGVQLTRKIINRKGYTVDATEYVDARFSRIKEAA